MDLFLVGMGCIGVARDRWSAGIHPHLAEQGHPGREAGPQIQDLSRDRLAAVQGRHRRVRRARCLLRSDYMKYARLLPLAALALAAACSENAVAPDSPSSSSPSFKAGTPGT